MTVERLSPIPHGLLAHLLDRVGPPGHLSPRHRLGDPVTPDLRQRIELAAAGYTTAPDDGTPRASFHPIAQTILDPTSVVDLRLWQGLERVTTHVCFAEIDGVGVTDAGGHSVITGPVAPTDLTDLVVPLLAPARLHEAGPGVEFELHTAAPVAAALATVIDATRTAIAAGASTGGLPRALVVEQATGPIDELPPDAIRLHSRIESRETTRPDAAAVDAGIDALAAADVLILDGDLVGPSGPVAGLAALLPPDSPGFRWQRRSLDGEAVSTTDRLISIGDSGLLLEVGLGAPGHVAWRTRTVDDVLRDLTTELAVISGVTAP